MNRTSVSRLAWIYLRILVGTALVGLAIKGIYDPLGLVTGGFTGIAIVVKAISGMYLSKEIPLWVTTSLLNIPVFIMGYFCLGRKFVGRTFFGILMLSVWLYILPALDLGQGEYMLSALVGGALNGFGMGLVLWAEATTGGTDMLAALIHQKKKYYSVVQLIMVLDAVIVLAGFFWFGIKATLYAVIAIYVSSKASDAVLEGMNYSKVAFIITDSYEEVSKQIMEELGRGVTGLQARGMYTKREKCVLYCVVSKKEIVKVKEVIHEVDANAFVMVSDAREVLGEGFEEWTKW